jgi:hypothetical protein
VFDPALLNSGLQVCACVVRVYPGSLWWWSSVSRTSPPAAPLRLFWLVLPQETLLRGQRTADHRLYDSLTECFTKNLPRSRVKSRLRDILYNNSGTNAHQVCDLTAIGAWGFYPCLMLGELGNTRTRAFVTRSSRHRTCHAMCRNSASEAGC